MRSKKTAIMWVILTFLIVYNPLLAQEGSKSEQLKKGESPQFQEKEKTIPTEDKLLRGLDHAWEKGDNLLGAEFMGHILRLISDHRIKSQKVADKIMAIPEYELTNREYPEYAYQILCERLNALIHLEEFTGVREYMVKHLNHESTMVQVSAARALLYWGDWELAAPVICRNEAYLVFIQVKDQRAIPLLEEATENGMWLGRILAASALYYAYGDSTKYPQVALDIILNAPVNTTDMDINRAKYMALAQVPRFNLTEALPGLIRLSQDTARGISSTAVGYLVDLGGMGHQEATRALIDTRDNHPDANVREQAKKGLLELEQEQK